MPRPQYLDQIENILKDKCTDYLIVCADPEKVYCTYNSKISAYGMAQMVQDDVMHCWDVSRRFDNGDN